MPEIALLGNGQIIADGDATRPRSTIAILARS
jgi:hypothetical protein